RRRRARRIHGVNGNDVAGIVARPVNFGALRIIESSGGVHSSRGRIIGARGQPRNAHGKSGHGVDGGIVLVGRKTRVRPYSGSTYRLADAVTALVEHASVHVSNLQRWIVDLHAVAVNDHGGVRIIELLDESGEEVG